MELKTGWYHAIAFIIVLVWGTTFISTNVPIVTLIASALFLNERITPFAIIGAAFILTGVVWAEKKR